MKIVWIRHDLTCDHCNEVIRAYHCARIEEVTNSDTYGRIYRIYHLYCKLNRRNKR